MQDICPRGDVGIWRIENVVFIAELFSTRFFRLHHTNTATKTEKKLGVGVRGSNNNNHEKGSAEFFHIIWMRSQNSAKQTWSLPNVLCDLPWYIWVQASWEWWGQWMKFTTKGSNSFIIYICHHITICCILLKVVFRRICNKYYWSLINFFSILPHSWDTHTRWAGLNG